MIEKFNISTISTENTFFLTKVTAFENINIRASHSISVGLAGGYGKSKEWWYESIVKDDETSK